MKTEYKATFVTLTKNVDGDENSYEATVSVNNEFAVQCSGNEEESLFLGIAHPSEKFHEDKSKQLSAYENLDSDEIEKSLEEWGFENNLGWLEDNAEVVL